MKILYCKTLYFYSYSEQLILFFTSFGYTIIYSLFTYIGGITMVDDLKNILLAGLGAAAYTYEKSKKVVDDMVEKGKLTLEEGKELSEELKRNMKEKESKYIPVTKDEMISLFKEMNFATKDDLQDIKIRLAKLEQEKQD